MTPKTQLSDFELPILGRLLIVVCGAYTLSWGVLTMMNPETYLEWSGIPEAHFAPGLLYWAWAGIVGGLFYCGYLVTERLRFVAIPASLVSFAGLTATILEFAWGNLNLPAFVVHCIGDGSGLIGFSLAAFATYRHRQTLAKQPLS